MPHTVAVTKHMDGARFVVLHVFIKSDGISPDLIGVPILDPANLTPSQARKPYATIEAIWSDLDGFNTRLDFDSLVDPPAWTLSQGRGNHVDFSDIGGIADRSGADGTGKLLLSTFGLDAAAKQGTLIIKLRK